MTLLMRKKVSSRRQQVRNNLATERFARLASVINSPYPKAIAVLGLFIAAVTLTLGLDVQKETFYLEGLTSLKPWRQVVSLLVIVTAISTAMSLYLHHYRPGLLSKVPRLTALGILFWLLVAITRVFSLNPEWKPMAVGTAVGGAIILTIAYDQRFAVGMIMFYIMLAVFAVDQIASVELLLVMAAGALSCCFSLREIRTRKKLI